MSRSCTTASTGRSPSRADQGLGLGKPLRLLATPVQQRIPIYLGAIGPQAVRQTGEIADGWLPFLLDPEAPEGLLEHLRDGLDRTGCSITDMDISPCAAACVADTIDEARDACRPLVSFYIGGMGAPKKNFYLQLAEQYGDGSSAHEVHRRWLAGDRAGAAARSATSSSTAQASAPHRTRWSPAWPGIRRWEQLRCWRFRSATATARYGPSAQAQRTP